MLSVREIISRRDSFSAHVLSVFGLFYLVLEAPATKKRELDDLADSLKVMNIRKDSQGNQHADILDVQRSREFKIGSSGTDIFSPPFVFPPVGQRNCVRLAEQEKESTKNRDFKRRVFRYLGTVNSTGRFSGDEVEKRLAQMKSQERREAVTTTRLGEDGREARMNSWRSQAKNNRFQEMTRLRRASESVL